MATFLTTTTRHDADPEFKVVLDLHELVILEEALAQNIALARLSLQREIDRAQSSKREDWINDPNIAGAEEMVTRAESLHRTITKQLKGVA